MDQSTSGNRPSGIPRLSRLPVPRSTLRPSPSRESLQQPARLNIVNPKLRNAPSRDQLSSSTSSRPLNPSTPSRNRDSSIGLSRDREVSTGTVVHTSSKQPIRRQPSRNTLFRKPSRNFSSEGQTTIDSREGEGAIQEDGSPVLEETEGMPFSKADVPRKARPSLSERAMETLQSIPSSPAIRKRTSSFFTSESPMRPPSSGFQSSRPSSSHQSDGAMRPPSRSVSSRPTSSGDHGPSQAQSIPVDFRASTNTFRPSQSTLSSQTPVKRQGIPKSLKTPSSIRSNMPSTPTESTSKLPSPGFNASQRSPSPSKFTAKPPPLKSGSKTISGRPLKPRASVNGLFRKPSMPALDKSSDLDRIGFGGNKSTTFSNTSSDATSTTSKLSATTAATSVSSDGQDVTPRKSSLALRDQIAKAKAAKRAAAAKQAPDVGLNSEETPVIASGTFDFGLADDPFNQQIGQNGSKGLLRKRIAAARSDGRLNIAAMGFKEIPEEVMNMYNLDAIDNGSWAEAVDLTRFVAAGNELELIQDDIFPDVDPRESADDENAKGNQFGGLDTLDLHGNVLIALPLGLRRLELLTTLNIANNKLGNECFEVISQIPSLRDLKIGRNELSGPLDERVSSLKNLETLDLQHNALTALPDGLADLVHLRVLNLTENKFSSLPFTALRNLPLLELLAAKNKLAGALVSADVEELSHLQVLDVTANSLTSMSGSGQLSLPSLHTLSCSSNRIGEFPDMSSWVSLLTVAAEDNNIAAIPDGFVTLIKIKNVNFSGNNIKVVDDKIGGMDNLDILRIGGNPLRDKKFSGMTTEDLKRALKARMAPPEHEAEKETDADGAFYSAPVSPISPSRPSSSDWPVLPGGVLDRSNLQSHSLNPVAVAEIAASNSIKTLELHHNKFSEIPSSIAFFAATLTSLSLAHNELNSDTFIKDAIELPVLKELNLSSNTFNSLQPLMQHLQAPQLEKLDISFNRLTSLPALRQHFPNLVTLFASNNTIRELSPESVKGLVTLDCSSNDINSLNSRIGLLGGPGGLQRLNVSGNRFRVPKYTILDKGTEATLAWLRDRIPAGEAVSPTEVD
ncbi:Leucine-rich repeat-containing protein [Lachnellula suecica]|uniref:Leucine-rich repeat-containing protein n=1 Tax=Lachnellula suecica TaxID=602035 RepID=A0A8T9C3X5_9HELO|nr:Leucine-rich repeat-containing protein [Lachnellula suecica]